MSDSYVNRRQVLSATGATIVGGLIMTGSAAADDHGDVSSFSTELSGDAEVPPVDTNASGQATFEVSEDGSAVHFEVYIDCIRNVNQGHVHLGSEDENGPVVAWLYPESQEPETMEGLNREFVLAEGTLTEEDLVGPFEGESVEALAEAMADGETYVNIHSEQNPGGEIRGQIEADDAAEEPVEASVEEEEPEDEEQETEEESEEEETEEEDDEDDEEVDSAGDVDLQDALEVVGRQTDVGHDTDNEFILFENTSSSEIDLSGHVVTDREEGGTGIEAEFPSGFTLGPGDQVRVTSGSGSPTDDEIFMGSGRAVWRQDGDEVLIVGPEGSVVFRYEYGDGGTSSIQLFFNQVRALFA
ncbi:MAG: CHRD domain-containing protein [Halalkalicoccus sp.]